MRLVIKLCIFVSFYYMGHECSFCNILHYILFLLVTFPDKLTLTSGYIYIGKTILDWTGIISHFTSVKLFVRQQSRKR